MCFDEGIEPFPPPDPLAWPGTAENLIALQRGLGAMRPEIWVPPAGDLLVGACFVCFRRGVEGPGEPGEEAWAAAVVARRHKVVAAAAVEGRAGAAYESGLLALREGPILARAVGSLRPRPDVLLVNATGRDHPRCAGLALHLGWMLDLPTVGVTHRTLLAAGEVPGERKGDASPLRIDDEEVGAWLRTRAGARPVAVHSGWRTDAATAIRVVMVATRRARTPQPLRRARRLARTARAGHTLEAAPVGAIPVRRS